MKLDIVSPEFPFSGRVPLVPPILEYLGALTLHHRPDMEIALHDANQRKLDVASLSADVVGISAMTATAPWAYDFADRCRAAGKKVILGGIHPTALPDEAAHHADAVVIGEAESVWKQVLSDAEHNRLQPFYRGERLPLDGLPRPMDGKLKGNYRFRAFFTMRGCPYRCTFCSVRRFFGDTIRYRPVQEVCSEIEARAGDIWFNGDDNIWGGDTQRSIELFNELSLGTKRHWYGFGDLKAIQGQEGEKMLQAARRSGLFSVWVGWESDSATSLSSFKATGKQGGDRITAVKRMQDAGMDVVLFVVLGGRHDGLESYKRTLDLADSLKVGIHPVLLTPLPGTELFEEYRPYLIPGLGWDSFTGVRAVFEHPDPEMTPRKREEQYHVVTQKIFTWRRILSRLRAIPRQGFPATHFLGLMMQIPMKVALHKAFVNWVEEAYPKQNDSLWTATGLKTTGYLGLWLASFVGVTIVHVWEQYTPGEAVQILEVVLLLATTLFLLLFLVSGRGRLAALKNSLQASEEVIEVRSRFYTRVHGMVAGSCSALHILPIMMAID